MTATRTTRPKAQPKKERPQEPEWATADLLGTESHEDIVLPTLQRKVRVRYLSTPEIARLELMPDYVGFFKLVEELNDLSGEAAKTAAGTINPSDLMEQQVAYQAHIAHRAVVDRLHPGKVKCEDCGDSHPRSLWSLEQTQRLLPADLAVIMDTAVQALKVQALLPFSEDPADAATSSPASTGGSTQPTTS